jgi:hypothetical protein
MNVRNTTSGDPPIRASGQTTTRHTAIIRPSAAATVAVSFILLLNGQLDARTYVVNNSRPEASDDNPGTDELPLRTINRAAQRAQPGDTVLVRGGVYRERVAPVRGGREGQPIVYLAAARETVIIKGSEIWQPQWEKVDEKLPIFRAAIEPAMFATAGFNPFRTPLKGAPNRQRLTLGQVFVDGHPLREVDSVEALAATPGLWMVEGDGTRVLVHFPPGSAAADQRLVEISTRSRIFAPLQRGLGYIHVKGFTMEHCANQFPERFWESDSPQAGALGCRAGHHWLIEGNTVRFAKSIGIDCGYEGRRDLDGRQPTPQNTGHHVIRSNRVTDNGCCGIAGMRSFGTKIVGNVIERNNWNHHTAPEIGGIKVHYFIGGRIEGNLIRDNDAHGLWVDNVYRNARIMRNVIAGNHGDGIFVELGEGPLLVDNNVIANTRPGYLKQDTRGDGFYTHDASGITFAHNLVFGSHRFGSFHLRATGRARAAASRITLVNNVFLNNHAGHINLPTPGPVAQGNRADSNLFSAGGEFLINPWSGIAVGELRGRMEKSLGRRVQLWSNAAVRMSLHEWQVVSGWGSAGEEVEAAEVHLSDDLVLTLNLGNAARQRTAEPLAGIDVDYFGVPIPRQAATIGPFQQLNDGANTLRLWPQTHVR